MSTQSLMSRARDLLQRRAGGALMIVPLAAAAPATADTVQFSSSISGSVMSASGGTLGHATGVAQPDGSAVQLAGDSMPEPPQTLFLPARIAVGNLDVVSGFSYLLPTIPFHWSGTFEPGSTASAGSAISVQYALAMQGFPAVGSSPPFGDLYWSLLVQIYDSSDALIATYLGPDTSLYTYPVAGSGSAVFLDAGEPSYWYADLVVRWDLPKTEIVVDPDYSYFEATNPDDELSITPSIRLSLGGVGSELPTPGSAPLPPVAWVGGMMLAIWGLFSKGLGRHMRRIA